MAEVNLYRDSFQNWKSYGIPKAQLIIADIPYGIGEDAYGSNPLWYKGGDNANGESDKAGKSFFIMEMPEYKMPSLLNAFKSMLSRGAEYVAKAATIILLCNTLVQLMQSFT